MSNTQKVAAAVLVPFVAYSSYLSYGQSFATFFTGPFTHPIWTQEFLDLCIALGMVSLWMIEDGRRRGARVWPWVALVPLLGSISPLLYLALRRDVRSGPPAAPAPAR